jgi:predicted metal-binding membrane protein
MAILAAVGIMSLVWMAVISSVVLAQKSLPPRALVDLPLAVMIIGWGTLIVAAPSIVPGLGATM